jgi:hypothetical protein
MKFSISILLIAFVSFVACLYLPWWTIAVVAGVVAVFIPQTPLQSFLAGFFGLFLLWGIMSALISSSNGHVLANKIGMIILKSPGPYSLIFLTAFIGATVAGFGALTGAFLRKLGRTNPS